MSYEKYKVLNKCIEFGVNGLFLICILLFITINTVQFFGINLYIVRSGSMEPEILTGSLCMINMKYPYEKIQCSDVIAFESGNTLVLHRVIQRTDEGLITKGDNNQVDDGKTTTEENYVGKNVGVIPYLGYFVSWIQTYRGKLMFAVVLMFIMILEILMKEEGDKRTYTKKIN